MSHGAVIVESWSRDSTEAQGVGHGAVTCVILQ